MATATKKTTSFGVTCPHCGACEAITLDLNDLTSCSCNECNEGFSPESARKLVAEQLRRWEAVCNWIAMAGDCLAE